MFETNLDVLNWYEKQPRAIDENFLNSINWADVKRYPIDKKLIRFQILYQRGYFCIGQGAAFNPC